MAKIIPLAKRAQETPTPSWKMELPITSYVQIYPRVSTPEQKKNVSAEMQVDRTFALTCGWSQELIILDDRDLGLSGQLRMEDRPAFNDMLRRIADGQVKIVIAAQVDRLFRDRWGKEYSKFMEICYLYGAKVVTLNHSRTSIDFMYDFSISWHVDQFRRKCEDAWRYIENHVGRMLAAKDELGESGRWAGGNLPIGFLVDRREKVDGKKIPTTARFTPICCMPRKYNGYIKGTGNWERTYKSCFERYAGRKRFSLHLMTPLMTRFWGRAIF
ncbi:MAG: recombinase family protein [Ktedonobacteraceae bacterium]